MKILNKFRKPSLSIFLASLVLFVSCEQHRLLNESTHEFDYSMFEEYKNNEQIQNLINKIQNNNINKTSNVDILNLINGELDYELNLPSEFLELSLNDDPDYIYEVALQNQWLSESDIELSQKFANDIVSMGFENAISNYENDILALDLTEEEFNKHNTFLNLVKGVEYNNDEFFKNFNESRGPWRCLISAITFLYSYYSLGSCVLIIPCALAFTGFIAASLNFADQCGQYM